MSTTCPPNSTDCLLRAILDANSGYNWNPLNFAFTAALSILGFIVATVTLIQGLLAAGPGRLKASRSAVGQAYSQKAHTRFDRTELRFRTLIRVPVLDVYKLLGADKIPASTRSRVIKAPSTHHASDLGEGSSRSLAGWSRLLEDLDLEDFSFETLPCATDYLPADVQAAPAYASVESLVIMALLAGCEKIQASEGFLRATGPNLQLEFQTHSTLGIVATYQHYFSTAEPKGDGSLDAGMIREALGHLRYGRQKLFELNVSSLQQAGNSMDYEALAEAIDRQRVECNHPGCASRKATVASWTAFFQDEKPNQVDIDMLATLLFADKPTAARMFPTAATDFRRLVNDLGNKKYKDTWFHQSSIAQDLALIPESEALIDIKNLEQYKALRTHELQRRDDSPWLTNTGHFPTKSEGFKLANYVPQSNEQVSCLRSMAFEAFQSDSMDTAVLREDSIVVSDQALTACFAWLANGELFVAMDSQTRAGARENLMLQLREMDAWLRRHGGADALCGALNMIKGLELVSPLGDEPEILEDSEDGVSPDKPELTTPKRKPLPESRMIDPIADESSRPTWTRCNRKWLAPETVNEYNLPWEFDHRDPAYLIIKERIPPDFQAKLFDHTRKLKEEQAQGFTSSSRDGQKYFVRKRGMPHRKRTTTSARVPSDRGSPFRRSWDANLGRTHRAGSKDSRAASQERLDWDGERPKLQEEHAPLFGRPAQDAAVKRQDEKKADAQLLAPAAPDGKQDHEPIDHGDAQTIDSRKSKGEAHVRNIIVTRNTDDGSRRSSDRREDSSDRTASRVKAMETMLLYRAMLFACLLATGTDTSDLLWLENRNRVVQVL